MMMMMSRRSEGSREPLWYDWIFFFLSLESFDKTERSVWSSTASTPRLTLLVFKGRVHQFWKKRSFAFLLRIGWDRGGVEKEIKHSPPKMSNCSFLLNPQQLSPRSLTSSRTTRPTSCCAASSRAGGSAGGQSRATVPLLTDLALVFLVSTGKKSRCKPLFKKKKKKRATSSSIWSVWTECFIYPHEHAVRRACPRHNVNFCSWFFFVFFCRIFSS